MAVREMLENIYAYKGHTVASHFINMDSPQLFEVICKIYDLTITPGTIFCVLENQNLSEAFNGTKEVLIDLFRLTVKYIEGIKENVLKFQVKCGHVKEGIRHRTKSLIESIYNLYKSERVTLEAIEEVESLNELLITSLRFLCRASMNPDFFDIFDQIARSFFLDVLLVNMISLPKEKELFVENEKEYCEYFQDLCYEQKSKTIKSYSMKLIENISDKIDYFFNYLMTIILSMLDGVLRNADLSSIPALENLKGTKFMSLTNNEDKVEICLLITSAVSFFLILRPEKLYIQIT